MRKLWPEDIERERVVILRTLPARGRWGYEEFCEALANPSHERHGEFVEWWGNSDYDPAIANFSQLNKAIDDLATKWARKTRRKI